VVFDSGGDSKTGRSFGVGAGDELVEELSVTAGVMRAPWSGWQGRGWP